MHNKNLYTDFTSFTLLKTEVYQSHKWVKPERKSVSQVELLLPVKSTNQETQTLAV